MKKVDIISHRGAAGLAPENSLEAIKLAIELKVDKVEIDIRTTSDGKLILMHDKKFNRTTDGKGRVGKLHSSKLSSLRIPQSLKTHKDYVQIPTFKEVLQLIKESDTNLVVEVKSPRKYGKLSEKITSLIDYYGLNNRVEILSFNKKFIRYYKETYKDYRAGIFVRSPFDYQHIEGVESVGVWHHSLSIWKNFPKKLNEKGLRVYAWTANSKRSMLRLKALGIDGIITDFPNTLIELVQQRRTGNG